QFTILLLLPLLMLINEAFGQYYGYNGYNGYNPYGYNPYGYNPYKFGGRNFYNFQGRRCDITDIALGLGDCANHPLSRG
ncbi:hypothetical protein PENTCL1PPCAC_5115, partial [Pristionchus entomophagus]